MLKEFDNSPVLIAIDQGYGQIKTPRFVFSTGIHPAFGKPAFAEDILEWFGQKYYIGQGHKDVLRDKTKDEDFRLLTMAAIAKELEFRGIRKVSVYLALGLPLDWATDQMDTFRTYMQTPSELEFVFNDIPYEVEILDLMIYPQSFSAIAYNLEDFRGMNILCDIGHGTMSMMFINSGKPIPGKVYSEMMNQRNGMTIGKFFAQAVLNNQNSTWRQSDWAQLRRIIREELENCPLPAGISVTTASAREPINKPPERAGKLSADALSFMQGIGFGDSI